MSYRAVGGTRTTAAALITSALVAGAVIGASAPAAAANFEPVEIPRMSTAAHGPGCAGDVWGTGNVYPDGDVPGTAIIQLQGSLEVLGVPAPWCDLAPTLHWRNLDTGAAGAAAVPLQQVMPFFWTYPKVGNVHLVTGPGLVEVTMTTDLPHTPSVTTFRVY